MLLPVLGVFISMLVIWRACDGFESASDYLGRNMSEGVRGATINAIGSSIPELLTAFIALLYFTDKSGFAFGIGTTAGSAVFNSAIIPAMVIGTVLLGKVAKDGIEVSKKVVLRDGISLIMAEFVLIVLLGTGTLGLKEGAVLVLMYAVYVCILLLSSMSSDEEPEPYEDEPSLSCSRFGSLLKLDLQGALFPMYLTKGVGGMSTLVARSMTGTRAGILLASAITVIGGACWLLVECCYRIGDGMGIQSYFVAVILAAAATSVPDTILSIKDAQKGNYNDAISNALGSNIFDICMCLGLPVIVFSLMTGQSITLGGANDASIAELRVLLLIITVVIFVLFLVGKKMNLFKAGIMLGLYGGFVSFIVGRAYNNPLANEVGGYLQNFLTFLK